ncbi:hypothetical protein BLOT_007769 [Blomia tropicalis]|nr:hypothetical protein BLOT_007769 [Blomia tropicalis]
MQFQSNLISIRRVITQLKNLSTFIHAEVVMVESILFFNVHNGPDVDNGNIDPLNTELNLWYNIVGKRLK